MDRFNPHIPPKSQKSPLLQTREKGTHSNTRATALRSRRPATEPNQENQEPTDFYHPKALFDREKTGSDQLPRLSTATKENRRSLEHFRRKVMPGTSRHRPMTTIFGIVKRREKHNAWR